MDEAQYDVDDSEEPADTCVAVFGDEATSVCQAVSGHSRFTVILFFNLKEQIDATQSSFIDKIKSG